MIEVKDLTKLYGKVPAINKLNFKAFQGEILGLLGPNGAGKTTTMRILSGYMPPTSGSAVVEGFNVQENSIQVRKISGYLPESVPLYPDLTAFQYLKYMAQLYGVKQASKRVDFLLETVHLTDRADSLVGILSKGLRQRLGIAQALLNDPKVLILDEPTIGLDPAQIIEVRDLIKSLAKEKTILFSTHILSEAQLICDRVLILQKGSIIAEGKTDQLESLLAETTHISVLVEDKSDEAFSLISTIPGVIRVKVKNENWIDIEVSPEKEIRPEISKRLIDKGLALLEMHTSTYSLEDIYIQLTKESMRLPYNKPSRTKKKTRGTLIK